MSKNNIFKCAKCSKTEPRQPEWAKGSPVYAYKGQNNTELCCKCGENICWKCDKKGKSGEGFRYQFEKTNDNPNGGWYVCYCRECFPNESQSQDNSQQNEKIERNHDHNHNVSKNDDTWREMTNKEVGDMHDYQPNHNHNIHNNISHKDDYNHEIEIHRNSLRESQEKKHFYELRLVEEENFKHGDYPKRDEVMTGIKESIREWEAKIQYEKGWLAKNGTEQDQQNLPENQSENTENNNNNKNGVSKIEFVNSKKKSKNNPTKQNNETLTINLKSIKRISLTSDGNLIIEFDSERLENGYKMSSKEILNFKQISSNKELKKAKDYLQKENKKSLSQQEFNSLISDNSNSMLTENPKNNMPLLIGGGIGILVLGVVIGLLVKNRVKKSKLKR